MRVLSLLYADFGSVISRCSLCTNCAFDSLFILINGLFPAWLFICLAVYTYKWIISSLALDTLDLFIEV